MPKYKQQLLAYFLVVFSISTSALTLQSTLNPALSGAPCAGQLTINSAGTARFFQAFFYSNTACTTLLGVGSIIDNTTGFVFTSGQTVRLNGQSIYQLANNLGIDTATIACMQVYINGSAQSSDGVSCTAFTDETCTGGTCTSSQTKTVSWGNNPSECGSNPRIYVANNTSATFSVCNLDFTSCTNTVSQTNPRGMAVNNGHAYSTSNTSSPAVYTASLNSDGSLNTVSSVATGYNNLAGITLNNNYVYFADSIPDSSGQGLNQCQVIAATGALTNCGDSGATAYGRPAYITFNNGYAYIANSNQGSPLNTITQCRVNVATGNLSTCGDSGGTNFTGPRGIAIYNGFAYVANWNQGNGTRITVCSVDSSTGQLSNCALNSSTCGIGGTSVCFNAPYGIGVYNNQLYVANSGVPSSVAVCSLPLNTNGSANTCTNYNPNDTTFSNPYQLSIY